MRRLILAMTVTLIGCSGTPPAPLRQPILGGTHDTADPAVVRMIARDPSGRLRYECSAAVISPHVVLTAAHCLDASVVGDSPVYTIFLGDDYTSATERDDPSLMVAISEAHQEPGFVENASPLAGHDIGVLVASSVIPVAPLALSRAPIDEAARNEPLRLIGYGQTDPNDDLSINVRYQTTTALSDFDAEFLITRDPVHTFCHGDSGGPELAPTPDGGEAIVGVMVFLHSAAGDPPCTGDAYATRVDVYAPSFIDPYVQMFDPPVVDAGLGLDGGPAPGSDGCALVRRAVPAGPWGALLVVALFAAWRGRRAFRSNHPTAARRS